MRAEPDPAGRLSWRFAPSASVDHRAESWRDRDRSCPCASRRAHGLAPVVPLGTAFRCAVICLLAISFGTGCDAPAPSRAFVHSESAVVAAALSDDGRRVFVVGYDGTRTLWAFDGKEPVATVRGAGFEQWRPHGLDIAPKGDVVLAFSHHRYSLWSFGGPTRSRDGQVDGTILAGAVMRGGDHAVLGLSDGRLMLVRPAERTSRRLWFDGPQAIHAVAVSNDARNVAIGNDAGRASILDASDGRVLATRAHPARVTGVVVSPDGSLVLSFDNLGNAFVWSASDGREISELMLGRREFVITAAAFSPDGKRIVTGSPNGRLKLWQTDSGRLRDVWLVPMRRVGSAPPSRVIEDVAFTADGRNVVVELTNGAGYRWRVSSRP